MKNIDDISPEMNEQLNNSLGIDEENENYQPLYRVFGENKILVSKSEGKLWYNRYCQAKSVMKDVTDAWNIAYKCFNSDQVNEKDDGNFEYSFRKLKNKNINTENLIWANNTGILPALYSQDPRVEITTNRINDEISENICVMLERLINTLFTKRVAPGLNLKNKVRKSIINCCLTNRGIIKVGYNIKSDLNEQAIKDIQKISEQLINAKNTKDIKELEAKLQSLEEVLNYSSQSGPFIKCVRPFDLFIDPNAQDQDGTDANWIIEREFLPTEYLKIKFGFKKDENSEEYSSVYNPDRIISSKDIDDDEDYFDKADSTDTKYYNYGYENAENYKNSYLTECFWVWDKIKRRVYLYSEDNWSYPLWVWDDPYELEEFFPYYILNFYENPNETLCRGEVSYYIDQQNTINMINSQLQKMREFGFNKYLFDSNSGIDVKDIQNWVNGNKNITAISVPPNKKIEDILFSGSIPYDKNQALYDKQDTLRIIDMISGTDAATRSGEYKTNTTNLAIQTYTAGKSMRLDDKRDAIEEWIGRIGWSVAQLCLMNMNINEVSKLIGENNSQNWINYSSDEISATFSLRCIGGTTVKPTNDVKKQQAMQMSQILGQFASASPYVVIVMLKMIEKSFDDFVISKEDIQMIKDSIINNLQVQQMQAEQQTLLQNAQANEALANADKNTAEVANIMSQQNGMPAETQTQTPNKLLNG